MNLSALAAAYGRQHAYQIYRNWILRTTSPERIEEMRQERQDGYRQGR